MGSDLDVTVVSKYRTRNFSTEVMEQEGSLFKLKYSSHTAYYIHLKHLVRIRKSAGVG